MKTVYLILTLISIHRCHGESCVETFPDIVNSQTVCSNQTSTCTVSCTDNHIYYDGNSTKTYTCAEDNIWTPHITSSGCLDKTSAIFWIRFEVSYQTTKLARDCIEAHNQAITDYEDLLTQQVSRYCNNELVDVGEIVINKTSSTTSSFTIDTVYELRIGDSTTPESNKRLCIVLLENNVNSNTLLVYGGSLQCVNGSSNVTKTSATISSDISRCPALNRLVTSVDGADYCVPDIPIVGVQRTLYSANISQDITLHCKILTDGALTSIYWQHGPQNITNIPDKKFDGSRIDFPSLIIHNATYDDAGEYTCHATGTLKTGDSPAIILNILPRSEDIPNVIITNSNYTVVAGDSVTLECTVSAYPDITSVLWMRNISDTFKAVVSDSIKFRSDNLSNPSLTINTADFSDSGMYICTATNIAGTGKSQDIQLHVIGDLPTIQSTEEEYSVVLGNNITLLCNYSSVPSATDIQWKYNNSEIISNITINNIKYYGGNPAEPSLTIINSSFPDAGEYMCVVTNYVGTSGSKPVTLKVTGDLPKVEASALIYSVILGDSITMLCNVSGIPEPLSVSWLKNTTANTRPISTTTLQYFGGNVSQPSLTVINVTNTDEGWYICTATNLVGTTNSEHVYLNITGDIPHAQIAVDSYSVIFGDNITIDCIVEAHPMATAIQWQYNTTGGFIDVNITAYSGGTIKQPSITIYAANFTHNGTYRCLAINAVGVGYSNITTLHVTGDVPTIHVSKTSYDVIVKENVTLPCNVSASPGIISVGWFKNYSIGVTKIGVSSDRYTGGSTEHPDLTILFLTKEDNGLYICGAENLIGSTNGTEIYLNVSGDVPKTHVGRELYSVILGNDITIDCEVAAHPAMTYVFWLRNVSQLVRIDIDGVRYVGSSLKEPSLTIIGARFEDGGEYICVSGNFVGESRSNSTLLRIIGAPPNVTTESVYYNVTEDNNVSLHCAVYGIPDVYNVSWAMNNSMGTDISSARLDGSSIQNPSLEILNTTLGDSGWYTCRATNLAGTTSGDPIYLNVTEKCIKYVPPVADGVLDCSYSNGAGICSVTCISEFIFRDGSNSKTYTCSGRTTWTPPLPMPTCLETTPSTYLFTISITYSTSTIATYCKTSHEQAIIDSYNMLTQQLSFFCNNEFVSVGPIVINSTNTSTSSFDITTTFNIIIGISSTSRSNKEACRSILENKKDDPNLLVYGSTLVCGGSSTAITKKRGSVTFYGALCPTGFSLLDMTTTCISQIPTVGTTETLYTVDEGDNVTLYCDVMSELEVTSIIWEFTAYGTKEGKVLSPNNDNRYYGGTPNTESLQIENVSFSDVGIYRCSAENSAGVGRGSNIELAVKTAFQDRPIVEILSKLYEVVLGENVTLMCGITSDLLVTEVIWQKEENGLFKPVVADGIVFHGSTKNQPSLSITGARFSDEGSYRCVATNYADSSSSNTTRLDVIGDIPVITIVSDNYTVQFGENVTLDCKISAYPNITALTWYRNDSEKTVQIDTNSNFYTGSTVSRPSLTIVSARISDKGWYICSGTNLAGTTTSQPLHLDVTANKPVITIPRTTYDVTAGDNVTLLCNIFAYPSIISSSWSRNVTGAFTEITIDGKIISLSPNGLALTYARPDDSGHYICQSTNAAGTTYGNPIQLNVIGGPPKVSLTSEYSVIYGNNLTLACFVTAVPDVTLVSWKREIHGAFVDITFTTGKYLTTNENAYSLTITNTNSDDSGKYQCTAFNFVGTSSNITVVDVKGGVPDVFVPSTVYHVRMAGNVTMYCNASAIPQIVTISWKTNSTGLSGTRHSGGNLATPSLSIYNVNGDDSGWYTCTATNIVGTGRSQNAYLNVTGDDICSADAFPSTTHAQTMCYDYSELVCRVTCDDGYVTRQGNLTVDFKCDNNLWQPVLPPHGCIDYVFPRVEFKIQVTYTTNQVATFCLASHEMLIQSYNATFSQQATTLCNNDFANIGSLVIKDMVSTTSSFDITTTYTLTLPFNTGSSADKDFCKVLLNNRLRSPSSIFTYKDTLNCNSLGTSTITETNGIVVTTTDICPGGSLAIVTSSQTYCVSGKPSVAITKPSYIVEKGDPLTISCVVESTTEIIGVYWYHNNSGVVSLIYGNMTARYGGSLPSKPSLTILSSDFSDKGVYNCIAYNNVGSGTSADVVVDVIEKVRDIPVVNSATGILRVSIGDTVTLNCSVNDKSEPSAIFWQKSNNGKSMTLQPFAFTDRFTGSVKSNPSLTITDMTLEDAGNYTCFAVNILGVGQGNIIQLVLRGEDPEDTPSSGGSVDNNRLSCTQTFLFLIVFAFTGIALLTSVAVLLYVYLSQKRITVIENIKKWKLSEKITVIALEIYFSAFTSCALVGIITVVKCSNDYTGATTALTAVAIIPGAVIAACYLGFCSYIQSKRISKIATSDSKEMISTSPVPDEEFHVKSWRGYQPSETLNIQDEIETPVTTFPADDTDLYASAFRTQPLIAKPSVSGTLGKNSLPPIGYTEYSEEKKKRRRRRKKRKKETFDNFYEDDL